MAATNYTPIQLYFSTTASAVPLAANLAQGELAINITDGKLYYEDNAGVVQVIATKGAGTIGGSTTQIQYNNAGALAGNAAMTFNSGTSTTTLTTLNLTNALGATYGGTAQSAYTQGDVLYASATNTLSKLGIGTVNYILTSTGSVPQWSAPSSIIVQTATNLAGGAGGSVPYQSAVDTTTFLAIGAANRVMTSSGTAPQWVTSLTGLTGVSSSSITNTSLTSGRVVVSTAGGLQADDADLTFNGTTLSAGGFSTTGLSTFVQTVTVGNSNFSGSAVFAPATPAKLYIGTGTVTDTTSAIGATNATGAVTSLAITPIAATNTSVTYTNAATLYIAGAPSAGTNVTLTNPYALYVAAGDAYFGGTVTAGTVNLTTLDLTNLEVTNIKAKDGTAAMTIADTTGIVSFTANPVMSAGTANGVLYLNGSKSATSGSALTFDGTTFGVNNGVAGGTAVSLTGTYSGSGSVNFLTFQRAGGAVAGALRYSDDNPFGMMFGTTTSHAQIFMTANTERMRISSTGDVGIGTTSPETKFQVSGNAYIGVSTSGGVGAQTGLTVVGGATVSSTDPGIITISSHNNARAAGEDIGRLNFYSNDASGGASGIQASVRAVTGGSVGEFGNLTFFTGSAASLAERARITSDGYFGINTANTTNPTVPRTFLDVRGSNIAIGVTALDSAQGQAFIGSSSSWGQDVGGTLALGGAQNSSTLTQTFASISGRRESALGYIYTGYMQFGVSDGANVVERMRITSAGDVGVNSSNPQDTFHVVGQTRLSITGTNDHQLNAATALEVRGPAISAGGTTVDYFKGFKLALNDGAEYGGQAQFSLGRWEESSTEARSSLVISLGNGAINSQTDADVNVMTLLSSGNVGIGTTSPAGKLQVGSNGNGIILDNVYSAASPPTTGNDQYIFRDNNDGSLNFSSRPGGGGNYKFWNGATQLAIITNAGNLLVGLSSNYAACAGKMSVISSSGSTATPTIAVLNPDASAAFVAFSDTATVFGSITRSVSAILYNTTSDQRLKENIQNAESASSLIDSLQVRQFDWKADGNHQRYGFVAQELVTVAPEAVHQPADTEAMMAVDYSKLVPMLVKEIQSLRKRLADAGI